MTRQGLAPRTLCWSLLSAQSNKLYMRQAHEVFSRVWQQAVLLLAWGSQAYARRHTAYATARHMYQVGDGSIEERGGR
jgi:hypothetical protein